MADLIDLCREALGYVEGISLSSFRRDKGLQRAVERTLELIGEVVRQLGDDVPDVGVPWERVKGMRVILAHAYHKVDAAVVYAAATREVATMLQALERRPPSGGEPAGATSDR